MPETKMINFFKLRMIRPWLRFEIIVLNWLTWLVPPVALIVTLVLTSLLVLAREEQHNIDRFLSGVPEIVLPLVAGVLTASVLSEDPAVELQLSLPTSYRLTLLRRLFLVMGWSTLLSLGWSVVLKIGGFWIVPQPFIIGQLSWIAPLLGFMGISSFLTLVMHSRTITGAFLGLLWLLTLLFQVDFKQSAILRPWFLFVTTLDPKADYWLSNRITLIIAAFGLLSASWIVLSKNENLSAGGEA